MNKIIACCFIFVSLSVGIGFIYSQCVAVPKELRGGIISKFDAIGVQYQEINELAKRLSIEFEDIRDQQQIMTDVLYEKGILIREHKTKLEE